MTIVVIYGPITEALRSKKKGKKELKEQHHRGPVTNLSTVLTGRPSTLCAGESPKTEAYFRKSSQNVRKHRH